VITPEYNHSIPGVLKNAIDNVFVSFAFRHKPLAAVAYSGGIAAGSAAERAAAQADALTRAARRRLSDARNAKSRASARSDTSRRSTAGRSAWAKH
jgi:hypothetical protein